MAFALGDDPDGFTVRLTTGSRFRAVLESQDGDWPDDTTAALVLDGTEVWPATVAGTDISWDVPAAVANLVRGGASARLMYGDDVVWAVGTVVRRG